MLLDLLHRAFGVERVDDDLVLIQARLVGNGLARVLGSPGDLQGLGTVEAGGITGLGLLLGVRLDRRERERERSACQPLLKACLGASGLNLHP